MTMEHEEKLQRIAEEIFDEAHKVIIGHAPFLKREVILNYPKGPTIISEMIRAVVKVLHTAVPYQVIRPKIVCLCGSTRFFKEYQETNFKETMKGRIVLSVGSYPNAKTEEHGESIGITPEQKIKLDELHLKKIELADEILVINVDGYVGESTSKEIDHARRLGKKIRWWNHERIHG
jgi:hypothetical protein